MTPSPMERHFLDLLDQIKTEAIQPIAELQPRIAALEVQFQSLETQPLDRLHTEIASLKVQVQQQTTSIANLLNSLGTPPA
ncbi:hypothetical protein [Phaeobacter italicus]|uniref:hypothetical protein n=1 Tax=Phaeobacter italicus TaxID=481446 RepID=UPI00248E994C|nr:hypothetical protein [Phaeobacter italicus]